MAAKKRSAGGANRSEFIRNILTENPKATVSDVKEAWSNAGHTDDLNQTLYYQIRRKLGLSKERGKKKRTRAASPKASAPRSTASAASTAAPSASNGSADYLSIEKQLDKLVAQVEALGDSKLADDLRQARRRASSKLV